MATRGVLDALVAGLLAEHGIDHLVEIAPGDAPSRAYAARHSAIEQRPVPGLDHTRLARWDVDCGAWHPCPADLWADGSPVLALAVEFLDDVACPVVERTPQGLRHRGPAGVTDAAVSGADEAWLERWWPRGESADVGRTRDAAWAWLAARLPAGSLLATVDYGHVGQTRPERATLTAHRDGREVDPRTPAADLTAHVAVDSLAAAGQAAGATTLALCRLREMELRLDAADPLTELALRSQVALWRDPARFGDFWWLLQRVGDNGPRA